MLPLEFDSVYHMAEALPFFDIREDRIVLKDPPPYSFVDCHQHLGWTYLVAKPIDYWAATDDSTPYFDPRTAKVDLGVYSGVNFHNHDSKALLHGYIRTAVKTKGSKHLNHTAPNLLREMDELNISHGAVLAIDLPKFSKVSDDCLEACSKTDRLLPFVSLHPKDPQWEAKLERYLEAGARGLKVHGEIQGLAVDDEKFVTLLKKWNETKLPVLVHSGVSDMQPRLIAGKGVPRSALVRMDGVAETLSDCKVMLGHAGMNAYEDCTALLNRHPNLYAEMDGQPPKHLDYFFEHGPHSQLVWGSDWPVYPIALQLAKILIATEGHPELRKQILHTNGMNLLGIKGAA